MKSKSLFFLGGGGERISWINESFLKQMVLHNHVGVPVERSDVKTVFNCIEASGHSHGQEQLGSFSGLLLVETFA